MLIHSKKYKLKLQLERVVDKKYTAPHYRLIYLYDKDNILHKNILLSIFDLVAPEAKTIGYPFADDVYEAIQEQYGYGLQKTFNSFCSQGWFRNHIENMEVL